MKFQSTLFMSLPHVVSKPHVRKSWYQIMYSKVSLVEFVLVFPLCPLGILPYFYCPNWQLSTTAVDDECPVCKMDDDCWAESNVAIKEAGIWFLHLSSTNGFTKETYTNTTKDYCKKTWDPWAQRPQKGHLELTSSTLLNHFYERIVPNESELAI